MADEINVWLAIIATTIAIISALLGGLAFIWRLGGKFSGTLSNLDGSIKSLNDHLIRVDAKADASANTVQNHEIRLVIIERELSIEAIPDRLRRGDANGEKGSD